MRKDIVLIVLTPCPLEGGVEFFLIFLTPCPLEGGAD